MLSDNPEIESGRLRVLTAGAVTVGVYFSLIGGVIVCSGARSMAPASQLQLSDSFDWSLDQHESDVPPEIAMTVAAFFKK